MGFKVCRQTLYSVCKSLRDICSVSLDKKNLKLGGLNSIVEIDESLFAKVKYHRGKDLKRKQVWVFGLVDRKTKKVYFEIVPDRTGATLLAIICERTHPGSIIYSDCWASYNKITELNRGHQTVNHSRNFVEPETFTCTNTIESLWNAVKTKFKGFF
jgi:transposase